MAPILRPDGLSAATEGVPGRRGRLWALTAAILLAVVPAGAEPGSPSVDPPARDYFDLTLDELLDVEVVRGASLFDQKTAEAPSSVTIVYADEIARFGYRSLEDVLGAVRGFYITSDRMYEYLGTRGFNRPADFNTRFLLLVDGHRVNDNVYDQVPGGAGAPVDLEAVDRIEIIRGPGASLYGTSAVFAVINVITRPVSAMRAPNAQVEAASFGTWRGGAGGGGQAPGGPAVAVRGSLLTSDGQDLYLPELDDPGTNHGRVDRANGLEVRRLFAKAEWGGARLNLIHYAREKELAGAPWDMAINEPGNRVFDAYTLAQLRYEAHPGRDALVTGRLDVNAYRFQGDYHFAEESGGLLGYHDKGTGRWVAADVAVLAPPIRKHRVLLGAEVRAGLRADQKYYDDGGTTYLDRGDPQDNWGLYAQDEFRPFRGVILNLGIRHDRNDRLGGTTSPRLALMLSPARGASLKCLYARGFRFPNPMELYYVDGVGGTKPAGPLDHERIETLEIVGERALTGNVLATLSVFRSDLSDLISLIEDPADGRRRYVNSGSARIRGAEMELRRAWMNGPTGRISYGFQETTDAATGEILANSPKHLLKVSVLVPVAAPDLTAAVEVRHVSRRLSPNGGDVDPYWLTHLTVVRTNLWRRLEVSAAVLNLFDERYADPVSADFALRSIEQDGRSFRVRFGVEF